MDEIHSALWEMAHRLDVDADRRTIVSAADLMVDMDNEIEILRDEIVRLKDHMDRMENALLLWVEYDEGDNCNDIKMMMDYADALAATKNALSRLAED